MEHMCTCETSVHASVFPLVGPRAFFLSLLTSFRLLFWREGTSRRSHCESLGQTGVFPGTNPLVPETKPDFPFFSQLVPATIPGTKGDRKKLRVKAYVPVSLARQYSIKSESDSSHPPRTKKNEHLTPKFEQLTSQNENQIFLGSLKEVLLRRVLRRRLVKVSIELEGFLEGGVFIVGAQKALRRQKHALSQSTTPFACTLSNILILRSFGPAPRTPVET